MKTKLLFIVTAIALTFASCVKEPNSSEQIERENLIIKVDAKPEVFGNTDTKTYIDNTNTIIWGTGEYMKLAVTAGEKTTFATSMENTADIWNGDKEAYFEFSIALQEAEPYLYQGIYPASAAVSTNNNDPTKYKVDLAATQNATANSYDPSAYIMVAKPETFTEVKTEWTASFRRAAALNKVTLTDLADDITSVEFTAPESAVLAGRRYFNLSTGESGEVYYNESNSVTVKFANAQKGTIVAWFTSWDTELAEGDVFRIVAKSATKSYTRTLSINSKGLKFKEGNLNTLSVNMSSAEVETLDSFVDGDYLILAKNKDKYYALRNAAEGNRRAYVDYTGSLESYVGDADFIWSIVANGSYYTIANDGKYLGTTTVKYAEVKAASDSYTEDAYLLAIDKQEDNTYKISVAKNPSWVLAKNNDAKYGFGFYQASGYSSIVFVPASVDTRETVATPTFSPVAGAVDANTIVTISSATDGATIYYTVDGSDPTTESTSGNTVNIDKAKTIKAIAVKEGYKNSEIAEASYTIKTPQGKIRYTYTITPSDFSSNGYGKDIKAVTATSDDGLKTMEINHADNNAGLTSGKIQFKKSVGYLYNTTDLGTVISVVLNGASPTDSYTLYTGTSENPSTTNKGGYFCIKETAGNTLTCTSITVTFKK